jgi:hypothetical protein
MMHYHSPGSMSQEPQLPWARALLCWWELCTRVRQAEAFTGSCGHDNTGGAARLAAGPWSTAVQLCLFKCMQRRRADMAAGMCAWCPPRWLKSTCNHGAHVPGLCVCIHAYLCVSMCMAWLFPSQLPACSPASFHLVALVCLDFCVTGAIPAYTRCLGLLLAAPKMPVLWLLLGFMNLNPVCTWMRTGCVWHARGEWQWL